MWKTVAGNGVGSGVRRALRIYLQVKNIITLSVLFSAMRSVGDVSRFLARGHPYLLVSTVIVGVNAHINVHVEVTGGGGW